VAADDASKSELNYFIKETRHMTVNIKVAKLHAEARLPNYAHTGPHGDLAADVAALEPAELAPGEIKAIRTGLSFEFPPEYGALVHDRSGLALKGICTLAGVIDPGYRGELKVVLTNLSKDLFPIKPGDRIAQLRIVHRLEVEFTEVDSITSTMRDIRGFGSTGT
jgi:dUTP pyrophosphatase